jgi:hypothetical protein
VYREASPEPSAANRQAPKVFTSSFLERFALAVVGLSHAMNLWSGQPRRRSPHSPSRTNIRTHSRRRLSRHTVPLPSFLIRTFVRSIIYCRPVFESCQ